MKKADIKVGGLYTARVDGKHTTVRVDDIRDRGGISGVHYTVTNLATGCTTVFHSAAKFKEEVTKLDPTGLTADAWETKPLTANQAQMMFDAKDRAAELESLTQGITGPLDLPPVSEPVLEDSCPFADESESTATATPPSLEQPTTTEEGEQCLDPIDTLVRIVESSNYSSGHTVPCATGLAAKLAAANASRVTRVPETVAGYTPTDEQRAILEAVLDILSDPNAPKVLVVNAGAGSGKTSTLRMLEELLHGFIQYCAYNRPLVEESSRKFKKAKCSTGHALAYAPVGRDYKHRLNGARVRSWEVASKLGITDYHVEGEPYPMGSPEWVEAAQAAGYDLGEDSNNLPPADFAPAPVKTLKAAFLAGCVTQALKKFSGTADREIAAKHFSYIPGVDAVDEETGRRGRENNDVVVQYLLPFAHKFWDDVCRVDGTLPFTHDYYFKMWQLRDDAVIPADHILLDEHQDTAPVFADIIRRQRATVILVGDECQRIYEWRGAMNAADLFPDAPILYLSQSFRFGQSVADVANSVLSHLQEPTKLRMRGLTTIPTRVLLDLPTDECGNPVADDRANEHVGSVCYLYRTNAGAVARILTEYGNKRYGHLVGKVDDVVKFVRAAQDLQQGRRTSHPELAVFENWKEVQEYVEEDPDGGDLKLMVKLIDQFKCEPILEALNNMPSEDRADFICSTAHKSKGREWDTVVLGSDFPPLHKMGDSDVRLLYVALTRPRLVLDLTHCTPFHTYRDKDGHEHPKIEVEFTVPLPTADELALYQLTKLAESCQPAGLPQIAHVAPQSASGPTPAAAPETPARPPVAAGNGIPSARPPAAGFSWTNFGGKWSVRGPHGAELGKAVKVVRKNGTSSEEVLKKVVRDFPDACIYEV